MHRLNKQGLGETLVLLMLIKARRGIASPRDAGIDWVYGVPQKCFQLEHPIVEMEMICAVLMSVLCRHD